MRGRALRNIICASREFARAHRKVTEMGKANGSARRETGVTRGQRLDMTMLALLRLTYPSSKNQIVRDMGLRNSPYMSDILDQLNRDGWVISTETTHGRRTDRLYSLTAKGEEKAKQILSAYRDDPATN